ncbi:hypothetical protein NW739_02355 [Mycoplasmopsis felis]|uniref:hypothetical protein n=1 Tax=Mycoplasmopsis felis TaxID=33923 RepID=UPI0021E02F50|nr:hypothetical protein [Mycoplasmopsis felis]MCU9939622.1 hypothetical protein [Mycoplasmopsis felis]
MDLLKKAIENISNNTDVNNSVEYLNEFIKSSKDRSKNDITKELLDMQMTMNDILQKKIFNFL